MLPLNLPLIHSLAEYRQLYKKTEIWTPVMQAIAKREGFKPELLERVATGSAIVYACGEYIFKLFCPYWPEEFIREEIGLDYFCGRLAVPVPAIVARGQFETWNYLVLERLPGRALGSIFHDLKAPEQVDLMGQLGRLMSEMKGLNQREPLAEQLSAAQWPYVHMDWAEFVRERLRDFGAQQKTEGLSDAWLQPLQAFLQQNALSLVPPEPPPLLHCDLTEDHVMVELYQGRWQITGLIDFGDAMCAHPLYDFGAPLVFYAHGRPELRRALLSAYGYAASELNAELEGQLWLSLLLHRFCDIPYFLYRFKTDLGRDLEPGNLDALRSYYCGLQPNT